MFKIFPALLATVLLSACSTLYETADQVAEGVGDGVTYYCENTDIYVREQFGLMVNAHAAPNSVVVTCANGYRLDTAIFPPLELPPVTVPAPAPAPAPSP